jgi:hypothetical protein
MTQAEDRLAHELRQLRAETWSSVNTAFETAAIVLTATEQLLERLYEAAPTPELVAAFVALVDLQTQLTEQRTTAQRAIAPGCDEQTSEESTAI